jgi:uncharacterized protein Usg
MAKLKQRDKDMLEMLCKMETQLVADRLHITVATIYSRLAWIRKQKVLSQTFVNQLYNYEKDCPKMKKLLTSGERKK